MRRGPKLELTLDMVVGNMQTVARRLAVDTLSKSLYEEHGSFSARAIQRKWKWSVLCGLAGLLSGGAGGRKACVRKICAECTARQAITISRYCATCRNRMKRNQGGL